MTTNELANPQAPVCGARTEPLRLAATCAEPPGHGPVLEPETGTEHAHRATATILWGVPTADQRAGAAATTSGLTPAEVADQRSRAAGEEPCRNRVCPLVRAHRGPCAVPLDAPSPAVERGALAVLERWPSAASIGRAPAVDIVGVALAGALANPDDRLASAVEDAVDAHLGDHDGNCALGECVLAALRAVALGKCPTCGDGRDPRCERCGSDQ